MQIKYQKQENIEKIDKIKCFNKYSGKFDEYSKESNVPLK